MQLSQTYHRILLKLSGEALMGQNPYGIRADACQTIAEGIKDFVDNNIQVGVVVGGGNIFRGIEGSKLGIARTPSDHMGMLATIMNAIALEQALENIGVDAVVMSAINCQPIADPYNFKQAIHHLEKNRVVIFAGGTGSPYFTTDTAAALRASEIQAQILLKATKVNGIYSKDPLKFSDAVRYEKLTYAEVLAQKLNVMDATSVALCMSNQIPILVFNMWATAKLSEVLVNKELGTLVH
ncbi:MAG: UMP kinase [Verrucomicrobia bacterium]|nr:UMP kinase [Verrucomicrobiota bacterium]